MSLENLDERGPIKTKQIVAICAEASLNSWRWVLSRKFCFWYKDCGSAGSYAKGGKTEHFVGAGIGKTVLVIELINNVVKPVVGTSRACWCWWQDAEDNDLFHEMIESGDINLKKFLPPR